jgi:hypothetical protein
MEIVKRTSISENAAYAPQGQTIRANRSATQWLFNPYSVADTTNWVTTTGVGKLTIGGLTKVTNTTDKKTPNKSRKGQGGGVTYASTMDFDGYVEEERFALNIANEIVNNYPRRVHRIRALEGVDDVKQVDAIVEILLGESMAVAYVDGSGEPVPVLPQMLEVLRHNLREIAQMNSPQKALLLQVGKEFESTIVDNIKLAAEDLKTPMSDVMTGKRAGFDVNAKRNFLAQGKPVPDTLKLQSSQPVQAESRPTDERLANALERFNELLTGETKEVKPETDETTVTAVPQDENSLRVAANVAVATTQPVEVEMEFGDQPKTLTQKAASPEQIEKAQKAEVKKSEAVAAEETRREEEGVTQCAAITGSGEQCKKDAVPGSRFCKIEAHQKQK